MSPIYVPGKVVLQKQFTPQGYMYDFPAQYNLWTPAEITTALWLDAADTSTVTTVNGAVSQWNDKSGNGRNAAQGTSSSRPTYTTNALNNKSVLTLDGTDDFMTVAHANALNAQIAPSTVAAIYKKSGGFRVIQKGNGAGLSDSDYYFNDNSSLAVAGGRATNYSANQDLWLIDIATWDGSTIKSYRDGTKLVASAVADATIVDGEVDPDDTPLANTDGLYIGKRNSGSNEGNIAGQIAGIIICNSVLSTLDRQRLEGYYAHLFGLTANLPSDHPYKLVAPTP